MATSIQQTANITSESGSFAAKKPVVPMVSPAGIFDLADGEHASIFGAPGSGKTTLALELLAHRCLERGYTTDEVLILSANRATATALRDRAALRLGLVTQGPLARTVQSLAFEIVRTADPGAVLLSGPEHDVLIADLVSDSAGSDLPWPERFTPVVRGLQSFRNELRDLQMRSVELGLSPEDLIRLGESCLREEWIGAASFIRQYSEVKDQLYPHSFDSAELNSYASSLVKQSVVDENIERRLGWLAQIRLLIVDDAQEATIGTAELLRSFALRGVSVVAIGDPDVASNGFRGGEAGFLGSLGGALSSSEIALPFRRFNLETVYRGTKGLRGVVRSLSSQVGSALGGAHRAAEYAVTNPIESENSRPVADPTSVYGIRCESPTRESRAVADYIRERHILDGIPWHRMAVVVRSRSDIARLERGLGLGDVPTIGGNRVVLASAAPTRALLKAAAIALSNASTSVEDLTELLLGPLGGLEAITLRRLRLSLRHQALSAGDLRSADELLIEAMSVPGGFATLETPPAKRAAALSSNILKARACARDGGSLEEILWTLWSGSGLADRWSNLSATTNPLTREANANLDAVLALFAAAERFVEREPAASPITFVQSTLASVLAEDSLASRANTDGVIVSTPAGLLGCDYDIVILPGLQEGVWPNLRPRGSLFHAQDLARATVEGKPQALAETQIRDQVRAVCDDEIRLFTLAVSRATRHVVLSCVSNDDEQPSRLFSLVQELVPMRLRPLHLRGLVGALRRDAFVSAMKQEEVKKGREAQGSIEVEARNLSTSIPNFGSSVALAVLAKFGVAGANPNSWYGLSGLSTTAPLVDLNVPGQRVTIAPSQINLAEESSLAWFIERVASPSRGVAAAVGVLIHAVMEEHAHSGVFGAEALRASIDAGWNALGIEPGWIDDRERYRANEMADVAATYLQEFHDNGGTLIDAERSFSFDLGSVTVRGKIDRIERSQAGQIVVVDIKTSATLPTIDEMSEHPQLGCYQLAVKLDPKLSNAAETDTGYLDEPSLGGAKLVFLSKPRTLRSSNERTQNPFSDETAEAFRKRLECLGVELSGSEFSAPASPERGSRSLQWAYRIHVLPAVSS